MCVCVCVFVCLCEFPDVGAALPPTSGTGKLNLRCHRRWSGLNKGGLAVCDGTVRGARFKDGQKSEKSLITTCFHRRNLTKQSNHIPRAANLNVNHT